MSLATYTDLQNAVLDYNLRPGDTTSFGIRVPDFIASAEAQFNRVVRNRLMMNIATTSTVAGQNEYQLPSDFLETRTLLITQNSLKTAPMVFLDQLSLETQYQDQTPGCPSSYTVVGNLFHIARIPDGAYTLTHTYYGKLASLSSSNPTNWLLTNHPDLYLYGSLLQAEPFLIGDQRIQVWQGFYQATLSQLLQEEKAELWNGGPLVPRTDVWTP